MLPRPFTPLIHFFLITTIALVPSSHARPTALQPLQSSDATVRSDDAINHAILRQDELLVVLGIYAELGEGGEDVGVDVAIRSHDEIPQKILDIVAGGLDAGVAVGDKLDPAVGLDSFDDINADVSPDVDVSDTPDTPDTSERNLPAFALYPAKVLHLNRHLRLVRQETHEPSPVSDGDSAVSIRVDLLVSALAEDLAFTLDGLNQNGHRKRDLRAAVLSELERRKDYVVSEACVIPTSSSARRSLREHQIEPRQSTPDPSNPDDFDYGTCLPLADVIAQVEAAHHVKDVNVVSSAANDTDDTVAKRDCVGPICDYSPRGSEVGEHSDESRKTTGWARGMHERSDPALREEMQVPHDQRQLLADSSSVAQIQTHDVSSLTSLIVYQGSVTDSSSAAIIPTTAPTASSSATTTSSSSSTSHPSSGSAVSSSATNALSTTSPTTKSKSAGSRRVCGMSLGGEWTGMTTALVGAFATLVIAGWL